MNLKEFRKQQDKKIYILGRLESPEEIGRRFGIDANRVLSILDKHGIKQLMGKENPKENKRNNPGKKEKTLIKKTEKNINLPYAAKTFSKRNLLLNLIKTRKNKEASQLSYEIYLLHLL